MSIVTKKGDKGKTSLYKGKLVSKDNIRIEACGSIDELSCYLGLAKSMIKKKNIIVFLELIQKDLFILATEVATEVKNSEKFKKRIDNSFVDYLNKAILDLEEKKGLKIKGFQLPGKSLISSVLDLSRVIARRVERRIVSLNRKKLLNNKYILVYLNRLSDLLYLLARLSKDYFGVKD